MMRMGAKGKNMKKLYKINIDTELGDMTAIATDAGICLLDFSDNKTLELKIRQLQNTLKTEIIEDSNPHLDHLLLELTEYFEGKRKIFDVSLDLIGTDFQKEVWLSLNKIPYGETISYLEQARLLGKPSAVRAVANANGKNKISIILPCHRVVGWDGSLTGYGGGLWRKKRLLEMENAGL